MPANRVFLRLGSGQRPEKVEETLKLNRMRNLNAREMSEINGGSMEVSLLKVVKDAIEGIVTIFC